MAEVETAAESKTVGATVADITKMYEDAVSYQKEIGITDTIPECVKFYEGDQWATATASTKHLPRPVVNIIEMICNNKKSQVLSSPIKIVYKAGVGDADIDRFNRFAEYEQGRLQHDDINNKICIDGEIKGSYCLYYFWDKEAVGMDNLIEGDIGVQVIDPLNVLFANPNEKDEQKQEWIILVSRENIETIKANADKGIDPKLITEDDNESVYTEVESETTKYATVLTRFFRVDGEVHFERATKSVIFNAARPFTPQVKEVREQLEKADAPQETAAESEIAPAPATEPQQAEPQETQGEPNPADKAIAKPKCTLYPIVFSSWKERDKSIYGRGEVETIIQNQKMINALLGLQIMSAQNEAMSAIIVEDGALKGQVITNEPAQVITDYSKTGNGIRRLQTPAMSQTSIGLADKISDITRVVSGASEIMNGEMISANMSGAAIAQLQAQALKPIEDLQRAFWRSIKKAGEILEQFMRFFFTDKKFQYRDKDENAQTDTFNSTEYKDTHFDCIAEAIAGGVMSEVAEINVLDNLFAKQAIDLKTYLNIYPELANRQKLLEAVEKSEQGQMQQMQQQMQAMAEQLQQQSAAVENAKQIVDENRTLKEKLLALQAEYSQKISSANQILTGLGKQAQAYRKDAESLAVMDAMRSGRLAPNSPQAQAILAQIPQK